MATVRRGSGVDGEMDIGDKELRESHRKRLEAGVCSPQADNLGISVLRSQ